MEMIQSPTEIVYEGPWDVKELLAAEGGGARTVEQIMAEVDLLMDLFARAQDDTVFDSSELFCGQIAKLAEILDRLKRLRCYAVLVWSTDVNAPGNIRVYEAVTRWASAIQQRLNGFTQVWAAVPEHRALELLADGRVACARQYLLRLRSTGGSTLGEKAAHVLAVKAGTSSESWKQLYYAVADQVRVPYAGAEISMGEALGKLSSREADVRSAALHGLCSVPGRETETMAHILRAIVEDWTTTDCLHGYEHWLERRNRENDVTAASVEALYKSITGNYHLMHRWCRLKARVLDMESLTDSDRLAPLVSSEDDLDWDEALLTAFDSFGWFAADLRKSAERFVENGWIDARTGGGRRVGAFCEFSVPSVHPFIMLSWRGGTQDLITLVHELGHGVHGLLSAGQGVFHQEVPVVHAETIAIFAELIALRRRVDIVERPEERFARLGALIDRVMDLVFRIGALWAFEDGIHRCFKESGALGKDDLRRLWMESQGELYGETVGSYREGYADLWMTVRHFFEVPGYLYSYPYGQLLALCLMDRLEGQKDRSVHLVELLESGGSRGLSDLLAEIGIEIDREAAWRGGIERLASWMDELEQLTRLLKKGSAA
ncbi:M3 family metallopeptidase [Nocardia ignorata]|uniref:Oligoendopeptidase F n=1 Tax=Nocardia ignorata TaxID=145285 RepID=A0A4R6PJB3_NOCIG|nr:M3 family metallopeptidase [Nocardia ignorata]TDP37693.1 oligoendopeptidase F [Nocardia ignorata]